MSTVQEPLQAVRSGPIIELRLQPNDLNSLTLATFQMLNTLLDRYEADPSVRVLLLTSGNAKFFSNGLDPHIFLDKSPAEVRLACQLILETGVKFFFSRIPTISVISGHCLGGGAVFVLCSDYRYMVDKTWRISFPEVLIGMTFPAFFGRILQDLVGVRAARDLLFSGKALKANEALEIGLVDEIQPAEQLHEKALEKAQKLAATPAESLAGLKYALRQPYRYWYDNLIATDIDHMVKISLTPNAQEGFRSIVENRRPKFVG